LADEHKLKRAHSCRDLSTRYHAEGEEFLAYIVTRDETLIYYYEPESKRQFMEWRHTSSSAKEKSKSAPSVRKLMLTLFWDMNGPILERYQEKGETVNGVRYSAMQPAIRSRRRVLLSGGVLFLHGNARPHIAAATVTTIQKLKFDTINNHLTVQSSLHPTIMYLARLGKHCEDEDFTATTR
jgi:hypothetical protein